MQYVGGITDPNYKDNKKKAEQGVEHMQTNLFEYSASHGYNGFLEDCTITLIDKTDGANPTRRGEYCRRILKTVSPYGLNPVV